MFWSPVRGYLQVFQSLYRANREISKVCLQIIFGYRSETGLLAWVREHTLGKCLFQNRTGCYSYSYRLQHISEEYQRVNMNYGDI